MDATDRMIRPWETRYVIKNTTVLAEVPELRVLDMTLQPGESVPWHRHPSNADLFMGITGKFQIHFGDGELIEVGAGLQHEIPVNVPHAVLNASGGLCRFLVIQGVGLYDYVPVSRTVQSLNKVSP